MKKATMDDLHALVMSNVKDAIRDGLEDAYAMGRDSHQIVVGSLVRELKTEREKVVELRQHIESMEKDRIRCRDLYTDRLERDCGVDLSSPDDLVCPECGCDELRANVWRVVKTKEVIEAGPSLERLYCPACRVDFRPDCAVTRKDYEEARLSLNGFVCPDCGCGKIKRVPAHIRSGKFWCPDCSEESWLSRLCTREAYEAAEKAKGGA